MDAPETSIVLLSTRVLCIFVGVSVLLLTVLPRPLRDFDYLLVGVAATMAGLVTIFRAIQARPERVSVVPRVTKSS